MNTTGHDCWNQIGVAGDRSCSLLADQVHCRNCDVYARGARHSLGREVDAGYRDEWARLLREPPPQRAARDQSGLVFRIGAEWLMLPTAMVTLVAPLAPARRLPHRHGNGLSGIANVGGAIYPAIALHEVLDIAPDAPLATQGRHVFPRTVLVQWEERSYALGVADLHGIVRYARASLQAPAATLNKGVQQFLAGVLEHEDMMIGVLDPALLGRQMARLLR
ncbi:MAG: chemotaxis protein CheW [Gammaproteobacteria bacterium]